MADAPPIALTISGSDCSAGAGLQADLKTFSRFGVHGLTVVTSVMSETPLKVRGIHGMDAAIVKEQTRILLESFPVAAVKTGVLHSGSHVTAVADALTASEAPLVIDPAMLAATGDPLMSQDAVDAFKDRLFPLAALITPNLSEARYLLGGEAGHNTDPIEVCARNLHEAFGCSILVTGDHDRAAGTVVDYLAHEGQVTRLENPWVDLPYAHGTGCTFSSAVTAGLARGHSLPEAVATGERFIMHALREAYHWQHEGRDLMALNHLPGTVFGED